MNVIRAFIGGILGAVVAFYSVAFATDYFLRRPGEPGDAAVGRGMVAVLMLPPAILIGTVVGVRIARKSKRND